jgi:hypothetical protein
MKIYHLLSLTFLIVIVALDIDWSLFEWSDLNKVTAPALLITMLVLAWSYSRKKPNKKNSEK